MESRLTFLEETIMPFAIREQICIRCQKPYSTRIPKQAACSKACAMKIRFNKTVEERFWEKVVKATNPEACWLWTGAKTRDGYGSFGVGGKRSMLAHRFVFQHANGTLPADREICHRCDVPACVNPGHLFAGTHYENMLDSGKKGRTLRRKGQTRTRTASVFGPELRQQVADLYESGWTQMQIADHFGISGPLVSNYVRNKTWVKAT